MRRFPSRALHEACCGDVHRAQSPVRVEGNLGQSGVRISRSGRYAIRGIRNPRKSAAGMTVASDGDAETAGERHGGQRARFREDPAFMVSRRGRTDPVGRAGEVRSSPGTMRGSRGPRDLLRCSNTGNRLFDFGNRWTFRSFRLPRAAPSPWTLESRRRGL